LGNYQLLDEFSNRVGKRAKELKEWIEGWKESEQQMYLERHLIPKNPDLWKLENFDKFLEERSKIIVTKVKGLIPSTIMSRPDQHPSPAEVNGLMSTSGVPQFTKVEFDRESLIKSLPPELQAHSILSDNVTWADYFIKNNLGGPQWSHRISNELIRAGILTISDMALLIMTLGLLISYKTEWGNVYEFDRTLPSGQKPLLRTKNFGEWSWKTVLNRLQNSGFIWNDYVRK
jgi:hypothetical protein